MACKLITTGKATFAGIRGQMEKRCPAKNRGDPEEAAEQLNSWAALEVSMVQNNALLDEVFQRFLIVNGILLGIAIISRFFPAGRPLALAASVARTNVAQLMTRIAGQKASNDATYELARQVQELLRRAA